MLPKELSIFNYTIHVYARDIPNNMEIGVILGQLYIPMNSHNLCAVGFGVQINVGWVQSSNVKSDGAS